METDTDLDLNTAVLDAMRAVPIPKGKYVDGNTYSADIAWAARRVIAVHVRKRAQELYNSTECTNADVLISVNALADEIEGIYEPTDGDVPSLHFGKCEECQAPAGAPCWIDGERVPTHKFRPKRALIAVKPHSIATPNTEGNWWQK